MNERKSQLQNILQEITSPQISLKKLKELYEKANIDLFAYYTTKRSEVETLPLEAEIHKKTSEKFIVFIDNKLHGEKLENNFHLFTSEELELFKWLVDKFQTDFFKKLSSI
jgi:hypothetical protein